MLEFVQLPFPHAEVALGAGQRRGGRETHDDLFAVARGQRGNADIVFLAVDAHGDAAVLRFALFGDVHAAHNLDAGDDGGQQIDVVQHFFGQHAVDAVADADLLFQGVEMNIAGTLADGLFNDGAHQLHDGGVVQLGLLLGLLGLQLLELALALLGVFLGGGHGLVRAEIAVQHRVDLAQRGDLRFDDAVGDNGDIVLRHHVQRVGHGQNQRVGLLFVVGDGQDAVLTQHGAADQPDDLGVDTDAAQVDPGDLQLRLQNVDDVLLGGQAHFDQAVAQVLVLLFLQCQRCLQLLVRNDAPLYHQGTQAKLLTFCHVPSSRSNENTNKYNLFQKSVIFAHYYELVYYSKERLSIWFLEKCED